MNEKTFKANFICTYLATWCAVNHADSETLFIPAVEADKLANAAWLTVQAELR